MLVRGTLLLLAMLASLHVGASEPTTHNDFKTRLQQGYELLQAEQFPEALDTFQSLYEDSKAVDAFSGVRNSYLVSAWYQLGSLYPPALEALEHQRQTLLDAALNQNLTFERFADLDAINEQLGDEDLTLSVFEQVHRDQPELADSLYFVVEALLLEREEYALFLHYNPDPIYTFETARHHLESELSRARLGKAGFDKTHAQDRFERKLVGLVRALEHLDRDKALAEVRKRANRYYGRDRVEALLAASKSG